MPVHWTLKLNITKVYPNVQRNVARELSLYLLASKRGIDKEWQKSTQDILVQKQP